MHESSDRGSGQRGDKTSLQGDIFLQNKLPCERTPEKACEMVSRISWHKSGGVYHKHLWPKMGASPWGLATRFNNRVQGRLHPCVADCILSRAIVAINLFPATVAGHYFQHLCMHFSHAGYEDEHHEAVRQDLLHGFPLHSHTAAWNRSGRAWMRTVAIASAIAACSSGR